MSQEEMLRVLLTVRSRYGSGVAGRITLVPSPTGCEMFWDGVFVASVDFELDDSGTQLSLELVRKFKAAYKKAKKTFYTLLDAVAWVVGKQTVATVRKGEIKNEKEQHETPKQKIKTPIQGLETGSFLPPSEERIPGWIEGNFGGRTLEERGTIFDLAKSGWNAELIDESREKNVTSSDMWLLRGTVRIKVELKNATTTRYNTVKGHVEHAIEQGCELLLLDMRESPITFEEITKMVRRIVGSHTSRTLPIDLEVWLTEDGKTTRYFRKKG